jgi:hypothetical protein
MKRALLSTGLIALLLAPMSSLAASPLPQWNSNTNSFMRPSRRTIRENIREMGDIRNPNMLSINEVSLDKTFSSRDYGVKVQYPSAWDFQENPESSSTLQMVAMFLSPLTSSSSSGIRQNVNLVVETLPSAMNLAQYTELGISTEKQYFNNYQLLASEDTKLAGFYRAHRVRFTASLSGGDMTFEQIWMLRGNTAHVWTFADSTSTFSKNVRTFYRMLDTLTVR